MFKKISTLTLGALGLVTLASACSVEMDAPVEELGTEEEAAQVCSNNEATNSIIAAMATVMAREEGRWQPKTDLVMDATSNWYLALTQTARDRCNARKAAGVAGATTNCKDLTNLLALQWGSAGMQFGGAQITNDGMLQQRIWSYFDNQKNCFNDPNPDQNQPNQCPAESHELTMYRTSMTGNTCAGGLDYWYKAKYAAGHPLAGQPLSAADAAQVRNNLKWAGEAGASGNSYLQFELDPNVLGDIKIDPLDENTGGGTGSTGGVEAALNPVWFNSSYWKCDNTNIEKTIGAACSCGGTQRSWKAAIKAGFFSCNP
jgi:hypothetical protein